ncbi:hypothetical protein [Nocardia gipuzkoensis]
MRRHVPNSAVRLRLAEVLVTNARRNLVALEASRRNLDRLANACLGAVAIAAGLAIGVHVVFVVGAVFSAVIAAYARFMSRGVAIQIDAAWRDVEIAELQYVKASGADGR